MKIEPGDIFKIKLEKKEFLFQYVNDDKTCMNSRVVCVFKNDVAGWDRIEEKLQNLEVFFYVHVDIKRGITESLWEKIGSAKIDNATEIYFRSPVGFDDPDLPGTVWNIWQVNKPLKKVIDLTPEQRQYYNGDVLRPKWIIAKLRTGKFGFKYSSLE